VRQSRDEVLELLGGMFTGYYETKVSMLRASRIFHERRINPTIKQSAL